MYKVAQFQLSSSNYITFTATLLLIRLPKLGDWYSMCELYRPALSKAGRLADKLLIHLPKIRCNRMSNTVAPL
jgi:hypothetical protein